MKKPVKKKPREEPKKQYQAAKKPQITKKPQIAKKPKVGVPKYVANVLKTEEEQTLYRLWIMVLLAHKYCRSDIELDRAILENATECKSVAKWKLPWIRKYVGSEEFRKMSVEDRIDKMDLEICELCIGIYIEAPREKCSDINEAKVLAKELSDCVVNSKKHYFVW